MRMFRLDNCDEVLILRLFNFFFVNSFLIVNLTSFLCCGDFEEDFLLKTCNFLGFFEVF